MPGRKIQGHVFPVPELAKYGIEDDGTVYHRAEGTDSRVGDRLTQMNLAGVRQLVGDKHVFSTFDQLLPGVWVIRYHQEVSERWNAAHPEAPWDNSWSPWLHAGAAKFLKKDAFGPSREHPHWWGAWGAREEQAAARISESDRVWTVILGTQSGALWRKFVADIFAGQPKDAQPTDYAPIVVLGPVAAAVLKSR
jgi:hypothetical protein